MKSDICIYQDTRPISPTTIWLHRNIISKVVFPDNFLHLNPGDAIRCPNTNYTKKQLSSITQTCPLRLDFMNTFP